MAYYTGSVQAKDLFATLLDKITMVHPGASESWWKKESSIESDSVYVSTGASGKERIVFTFKEGVVGQYITWGTAKDYTPGAANLAGSFVQPKSNNMYYFKDKQDPNVVVNYDLNITKDRIILHLQGDKLINNWNNPVMFFGIPVRYDQDDRTCIVRAMSEGWDASTSYPSLCEDSIGNAWPQYAWQYAGSPVNPSWGGNYFTETLHLAHNTEGLRGELEGIYGTAPGKITDGDIVDIQGTQFKAIQRVTYGYNAFPRDILLLKMK